VTVPFHVPIFAAIASANFEKIGVKLFLGRIFWTFNSSILIWRRFLRRTVTFDHLYKTSIKFGGDAPILGVRPPKPKINFFPLCFSTPFWFIQIFDNKYFCNTWSQRLQIWQAAGVTKAHHKITPRGKSGLGPGLGKLPKILESPFNIYATVEASDFKFGRQLGFTKVHQKLHTEKKWAWSCDFGAPQNFGVPFNISATAESTEIKFGIPLGFAKGHHKITPRKKSGRGPGLGRLPKYFGVPV